MINASIEIMNLKSIMFEYIPKDLKSKFVCVFIFYIEYTFLFWTGIQHENSLRNLWHSLDFGICTNICIFVAIALDETSIRVAIHFSMEAFTSHVI